MLVWKIYETFTDKEEFKIIKNYQRTNDLSILSNELSSLKKNASPIMMRSILSIGEGKEVIPQYKRKGGGKHKYERDILIAFEMHQRIKKIGGFKTNTLGKVANSIEVGEKFYISGDAVRVIYKSIARRVDMDNPYAPDILSDIFFAEDMGIDVSFYYKIASFLLNERFVGLLKKTPAQD